MKPEAISLLQGLLTTWGAAAAISQIEPRVALALPVR